MTASTSPPELRPAMLRRPDVDLAYRFRPSETGRWWVFLHGAGMDGHMFDSQFSAVPAGDGIASWDARGHGRSALDGPFRFVDMASDLEALIEALRPDDLVLVGQSLGGHLVQYHTERHPAAASAQVLIDCADNHFPMTRSDRWALSSFDTVTGLLPWELNLRWSASACGAERSTQEYAYDRLRALGRERLIEVMGFWRDVFVPDETFRFALPTLGVLGAQDRTGKVRSIMTTWPGRDPAFRLAIIPGAAHNANQDRPEAVNDEIVAFVQSGR